MSQTPEWVPAFPVNDHELLRLSKAWLSLLCLICKTDIKEPAPKAMRTQQDNPYKAPPRHVALLCLQGPRGRDEGAVFWAQGGASGLSWEWDSARHPRPITAFRRGKKGSRHPHPHPGVTGQAGYPLRAAPQPTMAQDPAGLAAPTPGKDSAPEQCSGSAGFESGLLETRVPVFRKRTHSSRCQQG